MSQRFSVVLIALYPKHHFPFIGESQGICAISGYLTSVFPNEAKTYIFDQQIDADNEILSAITSIKPDVIGFSLKMGTMNQFDSLYASIKQILYTDDAYSPLLVVGNSVAIFDGDYLLSRYPDVILSIGEGEISFHDIILFLSKKIPFEAIRNIKSASVNNLGIPSQKEYYYFDDICYSDRRFSAKYYEQGGEVYIEGSRGCAYCSCSICECKQLLGSSSVFKKWRPRPVRIIVSELINLKELGIENVTFSDEDFVGNDSDGIQHAEDFAEALTGKNIGIKFRVNMRVKSISNCTDDAQMKKRRSQLLIKLKQSGLIKIFLGFESGSQTQLKRYSKNFSFAEFLDAKKLLESLSIDYELGFINFDPLMSFDELTETMSFISENNCIPFISNIFKELRIQAGNTGYLNLIRQFERQYGINILGEFNHNEQLFPVIRYADSRVNKIVMIMRRVEKANYKLYYCLRILTQYSSIDDDEMQLLISNTLKDMKYSCYKAMMSICDILQSKDYDASKLCDVERTYTTNIQTYYSLIKNKVSLSVDNRYFHLREILRSFEKKDNINIHEF